MNLDTIRTFCNKMQGVTEEFPFDEITLVFKVGNKIFALIDIDEPKTINLKCDPDYALELRASYPESIIPGWHMNKKHWNTVSINGEVENELLYKLIDHSYDLVYKSLPQKLRENLQ